MNKKRSGKQMRNILSRAGQVFYKIAGPEYASVPEAFSFGSFAAVVHVIGEKNRPNWYGVHVYGQAGEYVGNIAC